MQVSWPDEKQNRTITSTLCSERAVSETNPTSLPQLKKAVEVFPRDGLSARYDSVVFKLIITCLGYYAVHDGGEGTRTHLGHSAHRGRCNLPGNLAAIADQRHVNHTKDEKIHETRKLAQYHSGC